MVRKMKSRTNSLGMNPEALRPIQAGKTAYLLGRLKFSQKCPLTRVYVPSQDPRPGNRTYKS